MNGRRGEEGGAYVGVEGKGWNGGGSGWSRIGWGKRRSVRREETGRVSGEPALASRQAHENEKCTIM